MFSRMLCACLLLASMFFSAVALAGKVELTTYYPAPYGEYKNLKSTEDSHFATASGNVGIGITNPNVKLVIQAAINGTPLAIATGIPWGSLGNNAYQHMIQFRDVLQTDMGGFFLGTTSAGALYFGIDVYAPGDSAQKKNVVILPWGGNVGIGTTTPSAKLAVEGTIKSTTKANQIETTKNGLSAYHPSCSSSNPFNSGLDFLVCNSACSRFCRQVHGYSGGTLSQWSGTTDLAICDCIP